MTRTRTTRETTLLCSACNDWLPDDAFHNDSSSRARRYRSYTCIKCLRARAGLKGTPGTLPCAICNQHIRKPSQYVCWFCSNNEMFNHVRSAEMQGRNVSIFTGRPSCPPPPIKPAKHDYSREFYGNGAM